MILKSLLRRMRNRFNVAVAEIEGMDLWQRSLLAIASVSRERRQASELLDHIVEFVCAERRIEVLRQQTELL